MWSRWWLQTDCVNILKYKELLTTLPIWSHTPLSTSDHLKMVTTPHDYIISDTTVVRSIVFVLTNIFLS